jgi:RNA polymerase sigma-70 factor (ECF subfamily)
MKEPMDKIDPLALMLQAKEGDEEAFSRLYTSYFSHVYRYIYFRVQDADAAEDLTQTVFLKVFERLPFFREINREPLALFFTVARNQVIDHWRKNKRIKVLAEDDGLAEIPDSAPGVEEKIARAGENKVLSLAIEALPAEQRDVLTLRFINELSYQEISGLLKKSEEAVRQIQCRALKNLRKYFKKNRIEL